VVRVVLAACVAVGLSHAWGVEVRGGGVPQPPVAASGGKPVGFFFESTSTLVSKRVGTLVRKERVWLTEDALRFDSGPVQHTSHAADAKVAFAGGLSVVVRLDTGGVVIASGSTKTFVRLELRHFGGALLELGDTMSRYVSPRVLRYRDVEQVAGRRCVKHRVKLGKRGEAATMWVEEDSREMFDAVRALARATVPRMHGQRASLVLALGGLHGLPRRVEVGDPKRFGLTWTMERCERRAIRADTFKLPSGYREDKSVPAAAYTLPEHTVFLGEATAAYFAPTAAQRHRSLLPRDFAIVNSRVLRDFYQGRAGSQQTGIFYWARPLSFYLAPELWRFPLSGRAIATFLTIGTAFGAGGLKYYPLLNWGKIPAE